MSDRMPSIVLLAHGLGLRLHSVTGGGNKCLMELGDSTTIADNMLTSIVLAGAKAVVTVRPDDPAVERLQAMDAVAGVFRINPTGFLQDVARLSAARPDLLVIESAIVGRPVEMAGAIRALIASPTAYTFTVAGLPLSDDPRSIRPILTEGGELSLSEDITVPRLCGLYRFRPNATAAMRRSVAHRGGTFHDFVEDLAQGRHDSSLVEVSTAFNVNWPDDLLAARRWHQRSSSEASGNQVAVGSPFGGRA